MPGKRDTQTKAASKRTSSLITYSKALNLALHDSMAKNKRVVLIGQGITSPWYVGGTCEGLLERFGKDRVIDSPVSECGVAAMACGMAIAGLKPVLVFPRMDFMLYAADPIINQMAKWHYMTGGRVNVPITIWAIINRFGCQGAQHSQDLRWIFERIPGLKVTGANFPESAYRNFVNAIFSPDPIVFFDDKNKYNRTYPFRKDLSIGLYDYRSDELKYKTPVPASPKMEKEYYEHP